MNKKKFTIPVIIISSVLAAILVAVIILCCITVRPLKPFTDYSEVVIASSTDSNMLNINGKESESLKTEFDKGLKKAGFSVMHAMLELVYSYGPVPEYKTELNDKDKEVISKDEDGNKIFKELTFAEVTAACVPSETNFVLTFSYSSVKTITVKKHEIKYDRMRMSIATTDGEIQWVTVYPYVYDLTYGEGDAAVNDYRINPLKVRANLSPLFISLGKIQTELKNN